ncbi:hypothetical protein HD554DRAFT_2022330 [Boletus coccyginus]|nr:hypothetical protein HD554DRAFT_2022330 [Boletus coccyginus]
MHLSFGARESFITTLRKLPQATNITIRSTHNTRIERVWVEVGTQFARRWRAFFTRLEGLHMLNPCDPNHLWLLHVLFLDAINDDCQRFRDEWNHHPISGPDMNNKSPCDLRFLGQMCHGIYRDDCEGIHPDLIHEFYGVEGAPLQRSSGAGNPTDEESGDDESDGDDNQMPEDRIADFINRQQQEHVHHEAVHVPTLKSPFTDGDEARFFTMLREVVSQKILPSGFGLMPAEWDTDHYPVFGSIHVGRRGSKQLNISLADPIWYNRACLWCQGLISLQCFLENQPV